MKALTLLLSCSLSFAADLGVIDPNHGISLDKSTGRPDFRHFIAEFKPEHTTNTIALTITNDLILVDDLARLPSGRIIMGLKSVFADGVESQMVVHSFDLRRADPPVPSAERIRVVAPSTPSKSLTEALRAIRVTRDIAAPPMPMVELPNLTTNWVRPDSIRGRVESPSGPALPIVDLNGYAEVEAYSGGAPHMFYRVVPQDQLEAAAAEIPVESMIQDIQRRTGSNVVLAPPPIPGGTNFTYGQGLDRAADNRKRRNE